MAACRGKFQLAAILNWVEIETSNVCYSYYLTIPIESKYLESML